MSIKEAVILAAGKGKRLDRFDTIKPLVKIGGKPLIAWSIERLREIKIKKIFIVAGDNEKLIKKELFDYPEINGNIEYIPVKQQKSMLSSILATQNKVSDTFFLAPCDLIFDRNPYIYFKNTKNTNSIAVLTSTNKNYNLTSGAQSKVLFKGKKIISIGREISKHNGVDVGIYQFTLDGLKEFAHFAKNYKQYNRVDTLLNYFAQKRGLTLAAMPDNEWFDVNTPIIAIRAELFLRKKITPQKQLAKKGIKIKKLTGPIVFNHKKKIETNIFIKRGLTDQIHKYEIIQRKFLSSPHYIITDENVNKLYGKKIHSQLLAQGFNVNKIVLKPGENTKSMSNYIRLTNKIFASGVDEKSIIISLGGGVVNNLAGFSAATIYRGIGLIHIPTNLMAQCDAAIGIKQGINAEKGKNLLGSYYEPMNIFVDPLMLSDVSDYNLRDGLSECIKHALAQNAGFFRYLTNYKGSIRDLDFLEYVVRRNIELKIKLMRDDFKEEKEALVLQYGHQIGHAIEYLSGYTYGHGESIAIGMRATAELSCIIGIAKHHVVEKHINIFKKYGLPVTIPKNINANDILTALRYDKKYLGGDVRFALVDKIGSLWHNRDEYTIPCKDILIKKAIEKSYTI